MTGPICGATLIVDGVAGPSCGLPAPNHSARFSGADVVARDVPICDEHYAALKAMQEAGDAPPPDPSG